MENQKSNRRKFKKLWTKTELKTEGYKKIAKEHDWDYLLAQAIEMQLWCAKRNKKFSMLRFYKWLGNAKRWREEKEHVAEHEERKTKEYLKRYGSDGPIYGQDI